MPSKVSKTKLRMRMTRTTSANAKTDSQPPAKTIKTSIENQRHHQNGRQRSQEDVHSNSSTNSHHDPSGFNNRNITISSVNKDKEHLKLVRHKKLYNLVKESDPDKSSQSQSSSSCDEKFCELDGPICKRYQIKSRLGKGAYGIVWEAYEKSSGNKVAVKKIFDAFRNDTDAQRTYREIMFLREFGNHPNIIRLLKVHRALNNMDIYLVFPFMEYDLHRLIKNSPQVLKDGNIRQIFYQMLKAVFYLHSADVIHRDLKPANILLDHYLNVKVGDFGLARSLTNPDDLMTETNPIMTDYVATRWYRPPEILLSCPYYTKGVDMWSCGCILAEMILKVPLFPGTSTIQQIETIMSHIKSPTAEEIEELCSHNSQSTMVEAAIAWSRESLKEIFEKYDPDVTDLIGKFLVFNPDKRITAEKALKDKYFQGLRRPSEEIIMSHPVSPPLNDYVQLPMGKYRSVIYDLIQVRKAVRPPPQQQDNLSGIFPQSKSHSHSHAQGAVVTTQPSSDHNVSEASMRNQSITNGSFSKTTKHQIPRKDSREVDVRKGSSMQTNASQKPTSCNSDYSERTSKAERSIGPEGDGNGSHKIRQNSSSCSTNYVEQTLTPVVVVGDWGVVSHNPTRKHNSTPNIPQVKRILGPDGRNLPLPNLKLVSTAPGFQGKNPRIFDRSDLSAREGIHPIPSDLRGSDKRLFEIYSNTDDLKEQIKAIEFQVRIKRENTSAQWISDLSNNLNKATVSDPVNTFSTPQGRGDNKQGQYQSMCYNKNGTRGGANHLLQQTKLPEILQSWNQGHGKIFADGGEQGRQTRCPTSTTKKGLFNMSSTYFQDPPVTSMTLNGGGSTKQYSAAGRNYTGTNRISQLSPREYRQSTGSFPHGQQHHSLPVEHFQSRSKLSYSQTHGMISASDLTEIRANLGNIGKQ